MAVVTFVQALAVAQAVLFFGGVTSHQIHLTRRVLSNATSSSTPSITAAALTSTTPVVSVAGFCYDGPFGGTPIDCNNSAAAVGFDPIYSNPYDTTVYTDNIVPANPSIASFCNSIWSSSVAAFFATDPLSTVTDTETIVPFSNGDPTRTTTSEMTFFENTFTWLPTATQCCLNCTISGGAIQVMVWPTPAPSPPVSTLVDTRANFTFTSPSVYVVFESIGATNLCGEVGTTVINKTLAFDPDELSTQRNYFAGSTGISDSIANEHYCTHATPAPDGWSTFDYAAAAEGVCTDITTSWWSYYYSNDTTSYSNYEAYTAAATDPRSCGLGCEGAPVSDFTCLYNPCSPFVSVPTQVYSLDPEYSTCIDGIKAFFDPPYTLTTGNGLVAFSSVPASSSSAAPAGTPASAIAAPTSTPSSVTPTPTSILIPVDPGTSTQAAVDPGTSTQAAVDPDTSTQAPADPSNTQPALDPNTSTDLPANPNTSAGPTLIASTLTVPSDSATPQAGNSPSNSPVAVATIGGITASQVSSNVVIGGSGTTQTLTPGGGAVTIGGTTFSLDPSTSLLVDGSTKALATPATSAPIDVLTIANGQTGLVVGSQTITAGAPAVTISGATISLASSGGIVVINGATTSLTPTAAQEPSLVTSSGATFLVVGSQTVLPGSAITISGTVVSLQSGGQSVVVGSSTEAISSFVAGAMSSGLGGVIVSIGGFTSSSGGASATAYNGTVFTGGMARRRIGGGVALVSWGACLGVWLL